MAEDLEELKEHLKRLERYVNRLERRVDTQGAMMDLYVAGRTPIVGSTSDDAQFSTYRARSTPPDEGDLRLKG